MPMTRFKPNALPALAVLVLGACAVVDERADEVTIEHLAEQFAFAASKADDLCATRGLNALHVMTGPLTSSSILLQTRTSVFKCVDPTKVK